jgi:hypothetical protein
VFRKQEWSNLARYDVWRLRKTLPLVTFLIVWLVRSGRISTCRSMRAGVAQGGLVSPVLFRQYDNDKPTPSRHVELAQYPDDTAPVETSCSHRFSSLIWKPIPVDWSAGYGIGALLSTSQRALQWSLLRRRDGFKNPEQCTVS